MVKMTQNVTHDLAVAGAGIVDTQRRWLRLQVLQLAADSRRNDWLFAGRGDKEQILLAPGDVITLSR